MQVQHTISQKKRVQHTFRWRRMAFAFANQAVGGDQ
jgi:hypothetical protein